MKITPEHFAHMRAAIGEVIARFIRAWGKEYRADMMKAR